MNASSEAPEDSALLEQILRESAAGGGGAGVHGGATDFGATASETVHGGAAGEGTNMAGVLSGVGARIADLKLGEKLGTLGQRLGTLAEGTGDKVLVTWNPDRVLAETVEVPVGIVGWQLRLPSGWGPYLCLPLQDGTYTRLQLAATVQALLQSTVGSKDGLEWKVMVLARQRRLCFRLISTATPPTTAALLKMTRAGPTVACSASAAAATAAASATSITLVCSELGGTQCSRTSQPTSSSEGQNRVGQMLTRVRQRTRAQ